MGSTTILNATTDQQAWHHILEHFPPHLREVQYLPAYVVAHGSLLSGGDPLLFVYQSASDLWVCPFLYRPIRDGWHDIESPYGYSGPLSTSADPAFTAAAHAAFAAWCQEHRVVAELIRLHPLIEQRPWLPPEVAVVAERPAALLGLSAYTSGAYRFPKQVRKMIRRAERESVTVAPLRDCHAFATLYREAMTRLGADAFYHFSDSYFQQVWAQPWVLPLGAWHGGHLVAALLCFVSATRIWVHLSATPERVAGASNLLRAHLADWGVAHGKAVVFYGTGRTAEDPHDSLLAFKRRMASDTATYRMGKRIHHPQVYAQLCADWRRDYPHLVERFGQRVLCYRERG